jgi:hypothetical protein
MRKLLFILLFSISSYSQEYFWYEGIVSDANGPLPGANVCVKGTNNCTASGFDGTYKIKVKRSDVLVISFMGMRDQLIKVSNLKLKGIGSHKNQEVAVKDIISSDYELDKEASDSLIPAKPAGKYYFSDNRYRFADLQGISKNLNKVYRLKSSYDFPKIYFETNFQTAIASPIDLPHYQSTFAQGRSINGTLTYQGPETNEVFSWGPNLNALEYSNNFSPYYTQGEIVTKGNGNGKNIEKYDENEFYRPFVSQKYAISATIKKNNYNEFLKFLFSYNQDKSFLERVRNSSITSSINLSKNLTKNTLLKTMFSYDFNKDNFSQSNFGWNKVMYANAVRPIHFYSKGGLFLADGSVRNFSKFENNPYYLLNYTQDKSNSNQISGLVDLKYSFDKSYFNFIATGQHSELRNTNALLPMSALVVDPTFDSRIEKFNLFNVSVIFNTQIKYNTTIEGRLQFLHQNRTLARDFYKGFTAIENFPNNGIVFNSIYNYQNRDESSAYVEVKHKFEDIFDYYDSVELSGNTSFGISSTLLEKVKYNSNFAMKYKNMFNAQIDLLSSYNYNQVEPSLQNNNLNFNSLQYALKDFNTLYNSQELFTSQSTIPTTEKQFRVGAEKYDYSWNFSIEFYNKTVTDVYAPVLNNSLYQWLPAFDYKQKGLEIDVKKTFYFGYRENYYSAGFNFTTYRNKVTDIKSGHATLPVAGFNDMYKAYVVGQPLGVLVGYGYARNESGQMIIGADGFPLLDNQPKILGNPNPDFIVGFDNVFKVGNVTVNVTFDWQSGGQVWNGTQQVLNYYGKSAKTETERNITGYVFPGVTTSGTTNTTAVSFYDPQLPVEQNRWARYGLSGTSEDNIIDASYFRLNNIKVTYDGKLNNRNELSYQVSLFANNVFILSKNNAAFINNPLFNSVETTGLHFFNSPLAFNSGIAINLKF